MTSTSSVTSPTPSGNEALAQLNGLDQLQLEDFGDRLLNLKFVHQGERPTLAEIDADVAAFFDAMR